MKMDLKKIVLAAIFAAFTYVATSVIKIPTLTGGYLHPGDAMVILCGVILGPVYGTLAAGIGSMMADLLGGYMNYVPITFVIKGLVAFCAYYSFHFVMKSTKKLLPSIVAAGICDVILVAFGYFFCECFMYGTAAALGGIPGNIIQGITGLIISAFMMNVLYKVPDVKAIME